MRCKYQCVSLFDIAVQLTDDSVCMTGTCYDGVTIVTEHMSINRVDLGYLNVKRFGSFRYHKVNAADGDLSLADNVCDFVYRLVKALAESICKVVDECLAAAVLGIFDRILSCIFRYIGQECCSKEAKFRKNFTFPIDNATLMLYNLLVN